MFSFINNHVRTSLSVQIRNSLYLGPHEVCKNENENENENENTKNNQRVRVLDVEHGSFTPLVFTTAGGMREGMRKIPQSNGCADSRQGRRTLLANNFLDSGKGILCTPLVGPDLPSRIAGEAPYRV